eukprot:945866-Prorocentrum_minimum.AAC.7
MRWTSIGPMWEAHVTLVGNPAKSPPKYCAQHSLVTLCSLVCAKILGSSLSSTPAHGVHRLAYLMRQPECAQLKVIRRGPLRTLVRPTVIYTY